MNCRHVPDVLLGDLDSVDENVVKFYQAQVYAPFAPSLTCSLRRHHRRTVTQAARLALPYAASTWQGMCRESCPMSFRSRARRWLHLEEHPVLQQVMAA